MRCGLNRGVAYFFMLLLASLAVGCGGVGMDVIRYPDFWSEAVSYDSIAVAPVMNQYEPGKYEEELGDDMVRSIAKNGTYVVADYTYYTKGDGALLSHVNETKEAGLVVFTSVLRYSYEFNEEEEYETREISVYAVDGAGYTLYDEDGTPIVDHYEYVDEPYSYFYMDSYATVNMTVFLPTGELIYKKDTDGSCHDESRYVQLMREPETLIHCAVWDSMQHAVDMIQPVSKRMTIDEDRLMGIHLLVDDRPRDATKFTSPDEILYITIFLPEEARLNAFAFDIIAKNGDTPLVTEQFVWDSAEDVAYTYRIGDLYESSGGKKEYSVRFWNNNKVVLTKEFKVTF